MAYSVIDRQDIIINLSDDSSIIIDPRYETKDICRLYVYYQPLNQENPYFVSSCQYIKNSGIYYVPFFYNNFDLQISTDTDNEIIVEEIDRSDG